MNKTIELLKRTNMSADELAIRIAVAVMGLFLGFLLWKQHDSFLQFAAILCAVTPLAMWIVGKFKWPGLVFCMVFYTVLSILYLWTTTA